MNRSWHSWFLFAIFAGAILAGMGWVTGRVVSLNAENVEARRSAWVEESVRNALWQMDAAISPMIMEEVSRPYSDYWAFNGERGELLNMPDGSQSAPAQPSPLLVANTEGRNLYFQTELPQKKGEKASINSPQALNDEQMLQVRDLDGWDNDGNRKQLSDLNTALSVVELKKALESNEREESRSPPPRLSISKEDDSKDKEVRQAQQQADGQQQGGYEYAQRRSGAQQVLKKVQSSKNKIYNWGKRGARMGDDVASAESAKLVGGRMDQPVLAGVDKVSMIQVTEDVMRPFWIRDLLLLARKVEIDERETIQGVWLDWGSIRTQLLARVVRTFPAADLIKADPAAEPNKSRLLASLPVRFVPGKPSAAGMPAAVSLAVPLTVAWVAVFAGVLAAGTLIVGVSMLSERRAAFVSAVTHELRTPLTTFRMYTEMLSEGYIKDEEKKQEYVHTLHRESERLGHLVENVLAYARLEKGTGSRTLEEVSARDLLDRAGDTLRRRSDDAGMRLVTDISDDALGMVLSTDVTAVEQILFNLVDNACKYAAKAEDRRIHVAVSVDGGELQFRVSDHGAGLRRDELKSVFKPFMKSAEKAAQSAPGVGLGLSLCQRTARQLGGNICYEEHREYGACFLLRLPTKV